MRRIISTCQPPKAISLTLVIAVVRIIARLGRRHLDAMLTCSSPPILGEVSKALVLAVDTDIRDAAVANIDMAFLHRYTGFWRVQRGGGRLGGRGKRRPIIGRLRIPVLWLSCWKALGRDWLTIGDGGIGLAGCCWRRRDREGVKGDCRGGHGGCC
jgi:hypothetical protein